jgi:hypothetical protein
LVGFQGEGGLFSSEKEEVFVIDVCASRAPSAKSQKFFGSFFQKRTSFLVKLPDRKTATNQ